jgi:hypothetical protein
MVPINTGPSKSFMATGVADMDRESAVRGFNAFTYSITTVTIGA